MAEAESPLHSESFAYKYIDSRAIELDLVYYLKVATHGVRKSLIYFHGGGMVSGWRKARFPGLPLDLLMQTGWQVLTVDHRLLPECGVADIVEDMRDLEKWIFGDGQRLANVDPRSIAVAGSSAGSLVSILALSTWTQLKPRAFLSLWGMSDTSGFWYSTSKADNTLFMGIPASKIQPHASFDLLLDTANKLEVWEDKSEIATPGSRPQLFLWMLKTGKVGPLITKSFQAAFNGAAAGPLDLVSAGFPSTVVLHGDADSIAPVKDSRLLVERFESAGVNAKLIEVPGADHGVQPYDNFREYIEKAVQVFDATIRPQV